MNPRTTLPAAALGAAALLLSFACGNADKPADATQPADPKPAADAAPDKAPEPPAQDAGPAASPKNLKKGLMVALSQFEVQDGKVLPKPGAARLEILTRQDGVWKKTVLEDSESNVFHKAMVYQPPGQAPGILTLGGTKAALKLWRKDGDGFKAETLWTKDFGGKHNRMRDAEIANLYNDGAPTIAVVTHDQGVIATVRPGSSGWEVKELDARKDTFVHESEVGDLNGDGALEFYTTPSEPNRFDGKVQKGQVMRYVPSKGAKPEVAADLGDRHAKEILVADLDKNGKDELYVAVEAETAKDGEKSTIVAPVEIRRYNHDTPADKGAVIATLDDRLCRFLTHGDIDGDGKKELIAAPFKSGLWLLRPGADPNAAWDKTLIDKNSSGFEHAAILLDLDEDGKDELYVASDEQGEVRRYTWNGKSFDKEVIDTRAVPRSVFTWNLTPVPVDLLK